MSESSPTEPSSPVEGNRRKDVAIPAELLQEIPEDKRDAIIEYVSSVIHVEKTTGTIPPPRMFNAYSTEAQAIILDESVKQGNHRRGVENRIVDASLLQEQRGMWLGFVLGFSIIIGGTFIILQGYSVEGLMLIAGDAAILATVYINERRKRTS